MGKNYLVGLSIFFSLCLITFACRKDIDYFIHGREKASSMLLESAKMWHLQHLTVRDPNSKLIPLWNDAWILKTSKGTRVVAPAPERQINNRNINIRRFVVFNVSGNNITDGRIVEFLGEKYNVSGNIDLLLEKYPSGDIPDFTGAVMQYDVNYYPISTTSYKNGAKDKRTAMVLNYDRKSLQKKTKDDLRMVVLSRYPAAKLGNKIASVPDCGEPNVVYNGVPSGLADDCQVTFYVTWHTDSNDCVWLITWDYISHTCPGGSGNGSAGGGSGGGSGSGSGGNGGPPYGGGGGGTGGGQPGTSNLDAIMKPSSNLTPQQKEQIEQKLKQVKQDCIGAATYSYMTDNSISFSFSVNPNASGQAYYNPQTDSITIKDPSTMSVQALEEELFHAYQNRTTPGGIAQYKGLPGEANVEFEAKLLKDINQWVNGLPGGYAIPGSGYQDYLDGITAHGTRFPTSYTEISTGYWIMLQDFTANNPGYSSGQINGQLPPNSLLSLINSSTCAK